MSHAAALKEQRHQQIQQPQKTKQATKSESNSTKNKENNSQLPLYTVNFTLELSGVYLLRNYEKNNHDRKTSKSKKGVRLRRLLHAKFRERACQ